MKQRHRRPKKKHGGNPELTVYEGGNHPGHTIFWIIIAAVALVIGVMAVVRDWAVGQLSWNTLQNVGGLIAIGVVICVGIFLRHRSMRRENKPPRPFGSWRFSNLQI